MRRVTVRKSSVHGRGVFALQAIPAGQRILEYRGEVTSWRRASARHRRSGMHGHTFIFGLADGRVIDRRIQLFLRNGSPQEDPPQEDPSSCAPSRPVPSRRAQPLSSSVQGRRALPAPPSTE